LREIIEDFGAVGTRVLLCEVRPNVVAKLRRAGVIDAHIHESLHDCLDSLRPAPDSGARANTADMARP
jgi:hypothetical protein